MAETRDARLAPLPHLRWASPPRPRPRSPIQTSARPPKVSFEGWNGALFEGVSDPTHPGLPFPPAAPTIFHADRCSADGPSSAMHGFCPAEAI